MQSVKTTYQSMQSTVCDKFEISVNELDVLMFLFNNPEYNTAKEIVDVRRFTKSTVSKTVEMLRQKNLIETVVDKVDRRIVRITLTDNSIPITIDGKKVQEDYLQLIYRGVDEDKLEIYKEVLNIIEKNINELE